jgi:hypothetical protein
MLWKDLTRDQRCEGLMAFSGSDYPPCTQTEFEKWIIDYTIKENKVNESNT